MPDTPMKILLIEDNPGDARLIREMLADAGGQGFAIEWLSRLADGLELLDQGKIDLVLLDLGLPDSQGLDTFIKAHAQAPQVPFVVLTGLADEILALSAVRQGAQDYLVKGATDAKTLLRAIRYATERKRAEIALEVERKKLYSLLNSLPAFVHLKAADHLIRFANRRFIEIFGEPGNKPCYEILLARDEPCEACRAFEVLKSKVPQKFEWNSTLDARTYEIYNYPFCTDDDLLVLTLGIDITERKQAEKALLRQKEEQQIILDSVPALIFYKDTDNRFVRVNRAFAEVTGLPVKKIEGKTAFELFPVHAKDYWEDDRKVITSGNPKRNILEPVKTPLDVRWVQTDKLPYRDEQGNIIGIIGFSVDISERKQAEEKLRESEQNLRALASQLITAQERERERIARGLHDELGQSLLVLKLQAGHIKKSLEKEQTDIRKECQDMTRQLDRLVDEVRRLARNLSPTMVRDLGLSSALNRLIEEFTLHYEVQTDIHRIEVMNELFSREAQINIYRIFQEALTNIGKYAQASRLTIAMQREDGQVAFMVADNGRGFKVDEVLGGDPSCRGLGLMAMKERVRMMGGTLEIKSEEGKGTRITFIIPVSANRAG